MREGEGPLGREPEVADAAAFGEQHHRPVAAFGKGDVTDRLTVAGARDVLRLDEKVRQQELPAHIGGIERSVRTQAHRPDRIALVVLGRRIPRRLAESRTAPDRVEQPRLVADRVATDTEPPHAPARRGEVPALRRTLERTAAAVGDLRGGSGIERYRRQARLLLAAGIDKPAAALHTVIVIAEIGAGVRIDAMDHAGLEIGHENLPGRAIESHVAECGAGVLPAAQRDVGEDARPVIVGGVEPVDRARTAAAPPHAGHPLPGPRGEMQAEGRRCADIDVGRRRIVEHHAEHLSDLAGGDRVALRFVHPLLAVRRLSRCAQVENAADRSIDVDGRRIGLRRNAGEARHEGFTGLKRRLLRCGRRRRGINHHGQEHGATVLPKE